MTARELLEYELAQSGKQIEACIDGLSEAGFDTKITDVAMTPREMLEHLGEAYTAFLAASKGGSYEWGSFKIEDKSTANVVNVLRDLRGQAVAAALAGDDDASQKHAFDYIIGHDTYHVAQLVLTRLQIDPGWDSYAIYG